MPITVETTIAAPVALIWDCWTTPADIVQWNSASPDWHTTRAEVDLRVGGQFSSRMEAKDGSMGFDFAGTYTAVVPHQRLEAQFGERTMTIAFIPAADGTVTVRESFDPEPTHSEEQQRFGQASRCRMSLPMLNPMNRRATTARWPGRACLIALAAPLLSACSAIDQNLGMATMFHRDYVSPPAGPDTALMRLSADGAIRISPRTACTDFSRPDSGVALFSTYSMKSYAHLHDRQLGMVGDAPTGLTSTQIRVPTDAPVVVTYSRSWAEGSNTFTCHVNRTFQPLAQHQYQVIGVPDIASRRCGVVIAEITPVPAPVAATEAPACTR